MRGGATISQQFLLALFAQNFLYPTLLPESGRFLQQRMTERKQWENLSVRHEGKLFLAELKRTNERQGRGEGKAALSNNLVYTKRQKDIYANRKHETT